MKICASCKENFLSYAFIDGKKRILSSRKYCLVCSPFNQYSMSVGKSIDDKDRKCNIIDWRTIQADYDSGMSTRNVITKYNISCKLIAEAKSKNLFKPRTMSNAMQEAHRLKPGSFKHSEKTKKKLSEIRTKYLLENPDKVPYLLNHASKESYPEMIFRKALETNEIVGWQQKYRCGIYEYDFAFIDKKIDIEIDGSTHKLEKVKEIDRKRDIWTKSNGWQVVRFEAQTVKKDVISCINIVRDLLET